MSNHLHVLLRHDPGATTAWSEKEVARRWRLLYSRRKNPDGTPCKPTKAEIEELIADKVYIETLRARLGSVSWFMKSLKEYIARSANKEDDCTGCFWDGRFKCKKVDKDSGVLACSSYVDLNPVRAGTAKTPEESLHTSIHERVTAFRAREKLKELKSEQDSKSVDVKYLTRLELLSKRDEWLAKIGDCEDDIQGQHHFPIDLKTYMKILDLSAHKLRENEEWGENEELGPVLAKLGINSGSWLEMNKHYDNWFCRFVGDEESLLSAAKKAGKKWVKGLWAARIAFKTSPITS